MPGRPDRARPDTDMPGSDMPRRLRWPARRALRVILIANLALLPLWPLSWAAPLARAGLLPLFGLSEVSVLSSLRALWQSDPFLALLVALFALVAPMAKTLGLCALLLGRIGAGWAGLLTGLGRLAMADIFLIALYISLVKGLGIGHVEPAWGLWLFTFCTLTSLALSMLAKRALAQGHAEPRQG